MTSDQACDLVEYLNVALPRDGGFLSDEQLKKRADLYADTFERMDFYRMKKAVEHWLMTSSYYPTIANLMDLYNSEDARHQRPECAPLIQAPPPMKPGEKLATPEQVRRAMEKIDKKLSRLKVQTVKPKPWESADPDSAEERERARQDIQNLKGRLPLPATVDDGEER